MKRRWRLMLSLICIGLVGGMYSGSTRQVAYAVVGLTTLEEPYTQTFDSLGSTGTSPWTNDVTINGWYASRDSYVANNGSNNAGALYSYGRNGMSDRALGSRTSNNTNAIMYGVLFHNLTGETIPNIAISYVGEQWRFGNDLFGNDDPDMDQTLTVTYRLAATPITNLTAGTWQPIPALTFHSPVDTRAGSGGSSNALDGNNAANRVRYGTVITPTGGLPNNYYLMLRWYDTNDALDDHGLAIDDLEVVPFRLDPTAVTWAGSILQVDPQQAQPGDLLTYVLVVRDSEGAAFSVSDTFDSHLTIMNAPGMTIDNQTVTAQGVVASGQTEVFRVLVRVTEGHYGALSNRAIISGGASERVLEAPTVLVHVPMYLPLLLR